MVEQFSDDVWSRVENVTGQQVSDVELAVDAVFATMEKGEFAQGRKMIQRLYAAVLKAVTVKGEDAARELANEVILVEMTLINFCDPATCRRHTVPNRFATREFRFDDSNPMGVISVAGACAGIRDALEKGEFDEAEWLTRSLYRTVLTAIALRQPYALDVAKQAREVEQAWASLAPAA